MDHHLEIFGVPEGMIDDRAAGFGQKGTRACRYGHWELNSSIWATFIISPGAVPGPNEFPDPPAFVPEATAGVQTNPVQMYHLGLWFDSAADAAKVGCPATRTPFNGEHNAGIQVLNTATFLNLQGPLIGIQ